MRTCTYTIGFALCALGSIACQRGEQAARVADTVKPAEAIQTEVAGAIEKTESEWRVLVDSVRATIGRDSAATAQTLRSAAASVRRQASTAAASAQSALNKSADELDSLAASIEAGRKRTVQNVDSAFARVRLAEAFNNMANAVNAWAAKEQARAAEELDLAADNIERAAQDTKSQLDNTSKKAIADAKAVARRVREAAEVTDAEFRKTVADLETQARKFGARIAKKT
jgi:hypothetical protein